MKAFLIYFRDPTGDQDEIGYVTADSVEDACKKLDIEFKEFEKSDQCVVAGLTVSLIEIDEIKNRENLQKKCRFFSRLWSIA